MLFFPFLFALQTPFQPINKVPLSPGGPKFDFIALGDNRPAGKGLPMTDTFKQILREVGLVHPAFVLSSGDLIYGNEESIDMYRHEMDDMQAELGKLSVPFFNAPGNHEINQRPEFEAEYKARFTQLYGAFEYGGWRFIALDTDQGDAAANIDAGQQAFLNSALSTPMPTCVYMHRPVFGRKDNAEVGAIVKQAPELHELFKTHSVKAVFEGHDHVFNHQQHDGIDYMISGGAGAPLDALPQDGGFFHYVVVHVDGDKLSFDVIPMNSLVVVPDSGAWQLCNYADVDIEVRDLVLKFPSKPASVSASVDKKGKPISVPAEIVSSAQVGASWEVHVHTKATKHRKTTITLG